MHLSSYLSLNVAPLILAAHLRVLIPSTAVLPNPNTLPPSTHATLSTLSQTYSTPLRMTNDFDFRNVSSGSYLLDVHSHSHVFAPLRVDVHNFVQGKTDEAGIEDGEVVETCGTFRGNEWDNKGEVVPVRKTGRRGKTVHSFEVKVLGPKEYLIEKSGFSPLSLLKNPMILIAGFSMLLVFGMPYLMDNMDPELKAEFEERQKTSVSNPTTTNSFQNFDAAAWLAGSSHKKIDSTGLMEK